MRQILFSGRMPAASRHRAARHTRQRQRQGALPAGLPLETPYYLGYTRVLLSSLIDGGEVRPGIRSAFLWSPRSLAPPSPLDPEEERLRLSTSQMHLSSPCFDLMDAVHIRASRHAITRCLIRAVQWDGGSGGGARVEAYNWAVTLRTPLTLASSFKSASSDHIPPPTFHFPSARAWL